MFNGIQFTGIQTLTKVDLVLLIVSLNTDSIDTPAAVVKGETKQNKNIFNWKQINNWLDIFIHLDNE